MPAPPRAASGRFRPYFLRISYALLGLSMLAALFVSLQFSDDTVCVLLNLGLFACPFLLATAAGGRPRAAAAMASGLALLVWGLGELKMHFFGDRLGLMDLYFVSQGANWGIVQRYPNVQLAVSGWVILALVLSLVSLQLERDRSPLSVRARGFSMLLFSAWCALAWNVRHYHAWEVYREDADCGTDSICGVMARLVFSYSGFEFLSPMPATDPQKFLKAAAALEPNARTSTHPDVVVWLHESTFDPAQYRLDSSQLPAFSMFQQTEQTKASGLLRVHTFGGRTWLSEFSLLTSLIPDDFGSRSSMVFNSVAPEVSSTLVGRFAAAGYDCVALMPTPREFYGAGRTYAAVGFQRVLTLRDFPEYNDVPGDEWDIADSDRLAEAATTLLREHRKSSPNRPIFLYMLSIKEHGPYSKRAKASFGLGAAGLSDTLAARLTDYVRRLQKLDEATRSLEHELSQVARPTLWAYFGDHQANFEEPQPPYRYTLPEPDHVTQYQLRANFPLSFAESPALLDIALLPSLIVDGAGLPTDAYFAAQSAIRRLCDGRLGDCPDKPLVDSYKGHVFGQKMALFETHQPEVTAQMP